MVLDDLAVPIVLAPLAGGPSTPELTAAVSEAGGLGFLASGYLSAETTRDRIEAVRELSSRPFGVNVFVPDDSSPDPQAVAAYRDRLRAWADQRGGTIGEPQTTDDDWDRKLELLTADPVSVVSFTFGCPSREVIESLKAAGSEVWLTVTNPDEAAEARGAGADVLVAQGAEAGGHRASFVDRPGLPVYGLLALLQILARTESLPLVASGGIATGAGLAAALCVGARAGQCGTAFMLCPEAGTSPAHREALRSGTDTALTRAFTGRLARGIRNEFMDEHSDRAPIAYPQLHYVTAPLRKEARERGDAGAINLWAGEAHQLAEERPAAEMVQSLAAEAREALETSRRLID
ncbi:MAG: nitronate monooxygenase [Actinobacteria bacterium]|nr:MAG: nitronate monooxygenase [Actinomycetota bacterium]